ncbi:MULTISPECIES: hypothetical protein [Paenibacillus]|uniref:hypothetical protein n=1 Tax=Paenibacillus TaxID=44249 RepID=UPI0009D6AED6|nr:hypothetical protein [Paenibacillus odorifer]
MKTYKNWTGNLREYLNVNDLVDEEMVNHFTNVSPSILTGDLIQIGEPQGIVEGHYLYLTLIKTPDGWRYAGCCHYGQAKNIS